MLKGFLIKKNAKLAEGQKKGDIGGQKQGNFFMFQPFLRSMHTEYYSFAI